MSHVSDKMPKSYLLLSKSYYMCLKVTYFESIFDESKLHDTMNVTFSNLFSILYINVYGRKSGNNFAVRFSLMSASLKGRDCFKIIDNLVYLQLIIEHKTYWSLHFDVEVVYKFFINQPDVNIIN